MRTVLILLLSTLVLGLSAAQVANTGDPQPTKAWWNDRLALRKQRQGEREGAERERGARAAAMAAVAKELIARAADLRLPGQDQQLRALVAGLRTVDPAPAADLLAAVDALPKEPAAADPKLAKEWARVLDAKRTEMVASTMKLGRKALEGRHFAVAHDCLEQVLAIHPDHPGLRRGLGMTKVDETWYGPRSQEQLKAGLVWDRSLGWVRAKERERYAAGEYFDLQSGKWTTLAEAEKAHEDVARGWVIPTEHLEVRGNARLADLVETANRLEEFHERIFAAYAAFFVRGKATAEADMKVIFGTSGHPRLVVNVARDESWYQRILPKGVAAGWSAGMFVSSTGASYFYAGSYEVMYHEFTHQILHMFTGGDAAPAWAGEGVAVYTQYPAFEDGRMVLGRRDLNRRIGLQRELLADKRALSLDRLLALDDHRTWSAAADPTPQYAAAGTFAWFLMEGEDRRWRDDFIDYLRDAYRGETNGIQVWWYLGMERADLEKAYRTWEATLASQPAAKPQRALR